MVYGSEYLEALPHAFVDKQGSQLEFSPWWDDQPDPPATDLAYCVYSFDLLAADPADELQVEWSAGPSPGVTWVGVSDWVQNSWSWHELPNDGRVQLPSREKTVDVGGRIYIAVVMTGAVDYGTAPSLSWLCIGAGTPDYDFTEVTELLITRATGLGGASFILMKDGELLYHRSFAGYDLNERVPIASASKWVTAGALLRCIDDGALGLSLDTTTSDWLPLWGSEDARKGAITLRQLYSHTSGVYPDALCLGWDAVTMEWCVDQIRQGDMEFDPGTGFYYGGSSMQVAGRILEVATGLDYTALFQERLAVPLGMTRTSFSLDEGGDPDPHPPVAGGLKSTARDYAYFLQMVLDGGMHNATQFISTEMIGEMLSDQVPGAVQPPFAFTPYENFPSMAGTRYGIGNWREAVDAESGELHVASSQGAFGFSPWIDFRRGVVGVLCVNDSLANTLPLYVLLRAQIASIIPEGS